MLSSPLHIAHIFNRSILLLYIFLCVWISILRLSRKTHEPKTGRTLPVALIFDSSNVAKHTLIKHTTMLYMVLLHIFSREEKKNWRLQSNHIIYSCINDVKNRWSKKLFYLKFGKNTFRRPWLHWTLSFCSLYVYNLFTIHAVRFLFVLLIII